MKASTKAKLHAIAVSTESGFDRALLWLAGSPFTLVLFIAWTLAAIAFGWWAGT